MNSTCVIRCIFLLALGLVVACSPVPKKYLREAVPNVTYSALAAAPQAYHNQLVVMGAVIVKEETRHGALWLHVKNRPLDEDYRPQLPPSADDPEAGWYWIVVGNHQTFPSSRPHWADMTVVGRVMDFEPGREPVLRMVYARGWSMNPAHESVWEDLVDANYLPSAPAGIMRDSSR